MGANKHRRSRCLSSSRKKNKSRIIKSRFPEDRLGRNRNPENSRRRARSESSGSRSSNASSDRRHKPASCSSDSDIRATRDRNCSPSDECGQRKKKRASSCSSTSSSTERRRVRDGDSSDRDRRKKQRTAKCRSRSLSQERRREQDDDGGRSAGKQEQQKGRSGSGSGPSVYSMLSASEQNNKKEGRFTLSVIEERKKKKELMKALETPEVKRARRLAKKEAKERKKKETMGWSEEYMGYTKANNLSRDSNLLGTFKWQKALEKEGIRHLSEKELKEGNKLIQEENLRELEKLKQLRLEREREKAMREQELEMQQREKEAEHFKTWAEQEEKFHLQQAKLRSKIRIRDGRVKPIDLLVTYIHAEDDDLTVKMHESCTFLNGLTVTDLDDLLEDIKVCIKLEQGKNADFWTDMTIITEDKRNELLKLEGKGSGDRREGIHLSVLPDVKFTGKTYSQLHVLHMKIETKIQTGGVNLDIAFWEHVLQLLRVFMAQARLRERHQEVLRQIVYKLKQEQTEQSINEKEDGGDKRKGQSSKASGEKDGNEGGKGGGDEGENGERSRAVESVLTEEDLIHQSQDEYDTARYSPVLVQPSELPLNSHIVDLVRGVASERPEDDFVRRAKEGMGGDEAQFSVEMPATGKIYMWADKYRPRKPRYFNRVQTGFEWNKYNKTHYDFENPPPKTVQGYKFNIFYPDLIDKRSTPQYSFDLPSPDNEDFIILRFHAGPPYEDIAFKIVNNDWEYSQRHGFRCQFANGILQLWFNFKRHRYRR